jgi:hypothetical protein
VEEFELPKASTVCSLVILSYFLVTAGIAYDIINEPPAIGGEMDEVTGAAMIWLQVLPKAVLLQQQQQQQQQLRSDRAGCSQRCRYGAAAADRRISVGTDAAAAATAAALTRTLAQERTQQMLPPCVLHCAAPAATAAGMQSAVSTCTLQSNMRLLKSRISAIAVLCFPLCLPGKVKPVTFMPHRMNGQYIIEGISGAMMYTIGGAAAC